MPEDAARHDVDGKQPNVGTGEVDSTGANRDNDADYDLFNNMDISNDTDTDDLFDDDTEEQIRDAEIQALKMDVGEGVLLEEYDQDFHEKLVNDTTVDDGIEENATLDIEEKKEHGENSVKVEGVEEFGEAEKEEGHKWERLGDSKPKQEALQRSQFESAPMVDTAQVKVDRDIEPIEKKRGGIKPIFDSAAETKKMEESGRNYYADKSQDDRETEFRNKVREDVKDVSLIGGPDNGARREGTSHDVESDIEFQDIVRSLDKAGTKEVNHKLSDATATSSHIRQQGSGLTM